MTDEQIKQNADAFAIKVAESHIIEKRPAYVAAFNAFISGAHSRDEEVNQLENALRNVNEHCHQLRNKVYELRNPWISVDDQMPKDHERIFLRKKDNAKYYGWFDERMQRFFTIDPDCTKWTINGVTHWMKDPKI